MKTQPPLWHRYLDVIQNPAHLTTEPWGRDRVRVVSLFAELYRLGERPSRREIAAYLTDRYGPSDSAHRKTILDLWTRRLARPHSQWRGGDGGPWSYPFVWADTYVRENDLPSVAHRLADVAAAAATALATVIDSAPATDEAYAAADELRAAAYALEIWHLVQDRPGEDWRGPWIIPPPRSGDETRSPHTRSGRKRNPYVQEDRLHGTT